MRVDTEITVDDYKAFVKRVRERARVARNRRPSWQVHLMRVGSWFVLVLVFTLLFRATGGNLHTPTIIVMASFFLLVLATTFILLLRTQALLLPAEGGVLLGRRTYQLTEEGIRETSSSVDSLTRWSGVRGLEETDHHLFVMVDTCAALIIPKRSLVPPVALEDFKHALTAGMAGGRPRG